MQCEAKALEEGLQFAISKGLTKLEIETDSVILTNLLNSTKQSPWIVKHTIAGIIQLLLQFNILHCFRECNQAANPAARKSRMDKLRVVRVDQFPRELLVTIQNDLTKSLGRAVKF